MRTYCWLVTFIILNWLFLSCSDKPANDKELIKAMEESLMKSNAALNNCTYTKSSELQRKQKIVEYSVAKDCDQ